MYLIPNSNLYLLLSEILSFKFNSNKNNTVKYNEKFCSQTFFTLFNYGTNYIQN